MRNGVSYVRMRNAAKQRPLLSMFLGSFLTISAIPLIVFLMVVMGSLSIGVVAFTAIQSGIILTAIAALCACLVLPLFLSGIFAFMAYCGLAVAKAIGTSLVKDSQRQSQPARILTNMAERARAITGGGLGGDPASRLVQVVTNLLGNRAYIGMLFAYS